MARSSSAAANSPARPSVSSASAASAAWWRTRRSASACRSSDSIPDITVEAAWSLPSQVERAGSVVDLVRRCDFISVHVPLVDATRHLIDERQLAQARSGAVLLNFSRDAVVDVRAVLAALESEAARLLRLRLPGAVADRAPGVIALAPPGRLHPGSRGELRRDGRGPAARLPGARQHPPFGQLSGGGGAAGVRLSRCHRQRQCAEHARADLHRDGRRPG